MSNFKTNLKVCDYPEKAGCQANDDKGDWLENGCPSNFSVHWLLPHEEDCSKFYYCVFGKKEERTCAPGTYFDYKIQVRK